MLQAIDPAQFLTPTRFVAVSTNTSGPVEGFAFRSDTWNGGYVAPGQHGSVAGQRKSIGLQPPTTRPALWTATLCYAPASLPHLPSSLPRPPGGAQVDGSFVRSHFLFSFADHVGGRIFSFGSRSSGNVLSKGDTGEMAAGEAASAGRSRAGTAALTCCSMATRPRMAACIAAGWPSPLALEGSWGSSPPPGRAPDLLLVARPPAAASQFFNLVPAPGNLSAFSAANLLGPLSPIPMPVTHQARAAGCSLCMCLPAAPVCALLERAVSVLCNPGSAPACRASMWPHQ